MIVSGGSCRKPDHLRPETLWRHINPGPGRREESALVFDLKRNLADLAISEIHPPDFPPGPIDQTAAIRQPGNVGVDTVNGPGFLHVGIKGGREDAILARIEGLNVQFADTLDAFDVGQPAAVRGRSGSHRATRPAGNDAGCAAGEIDFLDVENLPVAVLVIDKHIARRGVLGVVEDAAIR